MFNLQSVEFLCTAEWLTFLLLGLLAFLVWRLLTTSSKNLPPGPTGLPLVGYVPLLIGDPHEKLAKLSKKYGEVMSFKLLGATVVHLSGQEVIREAFVTQGNEFAGRPKLMVHADTIRSLGIVHSEGDPWKIHRRFILQTFRDFGFGKMSLEERIRDVANDINNNLEESKGKPISVKRVLENATANVICSLIFDKHFKLDDPVFVDFMDAFIRGANSTSPLLLFLSGSLGKYIPLCLTPGRKDTMNAAKVMEDVINTLIKEHQQSFDPTFLRDYVDVYLNEMRKNSDSGENVFTITSLKAIVVDLFIAGTETSANTLHWALKVLMFRPEMQKKIQSEIDEVVGQERLANTKDRLRMPYTEAFISEVLRISSLVPLSAFHSNPEEVKFRNYIIPKRSLIVPNLWAMHFNPKYWPEPDNFDPTRFLNQNGGMEKKENLFPFSIGKRFCLGENLARAEIFIFLTTMLQRFDLAPPDGDTDSKLKPITAGFLRLLNPYKLCARPRK